MGHARVGLVSCTSKKLKHAAPARELYAASPNFRKWVAWVERSCDRWFVLSAKHHLVHPDEVLAPYDKTLDDEPAAEKRRWSTHVVSELQAALGDLSRHSFEIHASRNYWAFGLRQQLEARAATVTIPAESLDMYQRSAFYSTTGSGQRELLPGNRGAHSPGSYEPLREYLAGLDDRHVELSFEDVESVLDRELPASARRHPAWWANSRHGHSHASAWLDAGWEVHAADLETERVTFRSTATS